ncbi:MAG: Rieske 2Fe-2S domain-containing protein [Bacteroidetes bacterium]|nr:Rieske 2Fe-2S domain-containing protein [Bacteroidota bacterium]
MLFKKIIKWHKLFDSLLAANAEVAMGRVTTVQAGRKKICVAHTPEGFFAVNDKCPHNGASLGNGHCTDEGTVVCPVHRYHFDLKTGRAKSGLGDFVETYPIEIREDGVYIGFKEIAWNLF